ncbi:hypothetical protein ABU614_07730 [Lysobacter firmicutimachus]|uniref:Uncharacterized protein n=1 Tax=Lysobacter firmicutimachus TaxID=1792846 RepID=A0AAU8MVN3_9GAMM
MDARSAVIARIPARVHILLARAANTAVVLRRGPSKRVCVLGWNRDDDRVAVGQWLKGRIYERRCDLSPDGRHLLYFASNQGRRPSSWSAVSRAPYLKALDFFPKGDTYQGGGLFLDRGEYWLNGSHCVERTDSGLRRRSEPPSPERYGSDCTGVYYLRLQRDGWALKHADPSSGSTLTTFEKPAGGHWLLRKIAYAGLVERPGRGHCHDRHALYDRRSERLIDLPDWEWAEFDRGELLWVEHGGLFRGAIAADGTLSRQQVYDFNPLSWQNLEAPY